MTAATATGVARVSAVFFDFGGVLTSSVFEAFARVSSDLSGDRSLLARLLTEEPSLHAVLSAHERGDVDVTALEEATARALLGEGVVADTRGMVDSVQALLVPDPAMCALVGEVRGRGVQVGLLSNSIGRGCYSGFDLEAMFDTVVISGVERIRKPDPAIFSLACERLGVHPGAAVFVDDMEANIVAARSLGLRTVHHGSPGVTTALIRGWLDDA